MSDDKENQLTFKLSMDMCSSAQNFANYLRSYINYCLKNVKTQEDWLGAHNFFKEHVMFKVEEIETKMFNEILKVRKFL